MKPNIRLEYVLFLSTYTARSRTECDYMTDKQLYAAMVEFNQKEAKHELQPR